MFGSKRPQGAQGGDAATGKIKLPKATIRPTSADLRQIKEKANESRNREVELQWSEPGSGKTYLLTVKWNSGPVEPIWILLEDAGEGTNLVCQYATIEHELINDVVCMLDRTSMPAGPAPEAVKAAVHAEFAKKQQQKWDQAQQDLQDQQASFAAGGAPPPQGFGQQQPGFAQHQPQAQPGYGSPQPGYGQPGYGQPTAPGFNQPTGQPGYAQPTGPGFNQPPGQQGYAQPTGTDFNQQQPPQSFGQAGQQGFGASPPVPAQQAAPTGFNSVAKPNLPPDPRGFSGGAGYAPPAGGRIDDERNSPQARPQAQVAGSLDDMPAAKVLLEAAANRVNGKLEIIGDEHVGEIYYVDGVPKHAASASAYGDGAIREVVTWERGNYAFYSEQKTDMRSVEGRLEQLVEEGLTMLDQKRHLKRAGLTYDSWLIRKHKSLSESELKLMLTKGAPIDFAFQKKMYDYLRHKRRFTDLLRDHPMDSTMWTTVLYNFLSCGLIDLKAPDAVQGGPLDFLQGAQGQLETLNNAFVRPETGLYSYAALLYFTEYEYNRFEAYGYPLSLVIFEVHRKREAGGGSDLLTGQAANVASQRINLVKRPLDTLGHFETLDYGLLLPNTTGASAAWVANRIYENLTATPLADNVDRNTLSLAFGIASLPNDGDDLQALVTAARDAKVKAKSATIPIVLSRPSRR